METETVEKTIRDLLNKNLRFEAIVHLRQLGYSYLDAKTFVNTIAACMDKFNLIW